MSLFDLTPFLRSPRLPDIVAALKERLKMELAARQRFYDNMDDGNYEFIDGEIIRLGPSRNCELIATQNLAILLDTYADIHRLGQVRGGKCLCVFPRNDYAPDIVFFGPENSARIDPPFDTTANLASLKKMIS